MEILSSNINSDSIDLVADSPVARFTLSYGRGFRTRYSATPNNKNITITKEALGLVTLDNTYFRLEIEDEVNNKAAIGLYNIEVLNERTAKDYDILKLKQELDNLNYYDGILHDLNQRKAFLEANDFFFNYITFLEKKLNGNNLIYHLKGSKKP